VRHHVYVRVVQLLVVLMVVLTYSWVAPLLMPFGVLFYAFAYLMYKYQLLYVYINNDQSGGYVPRACLTLS